MLLAKYRNYDNFAELFFLIQFCINSSVFSERGALKKPVPKKTVSI